ncbi:Beta-lactamase domain-containing protein 2-like protein 1 [Colletotrichum truncatum]|uniref:Beta-lactamase domain-containing protein 2-like protein 1 n=1 Tax=Colletotrichum truncatum TaxID=5467 RepID=A0ACC3YUL6_COLTU|nr:Beta-lactamase domain-containing protein 2-like protein 1 [Colletotrichum truncatum]KAF6785819.1 Beta-lactamase domain-containing protein 2-like protein 1 [Colletotrichum truncatum]
MAQTQGTCDPRFEEVRTQLQQFIESGEEVGAAITVNLDGKDVVDIWGGYADKENNKPWDKDTIVNVFSTTKDVLALAVLILVDRKVFSVTDKVSKYWPEFAANGKENIEIRHILSHTSGVSGWDADRPLSFEEISNFDEANAKLAAQALWWTPGSASGYHTWTFGHLLNEIVRRATGTSLKDFVLEEIVKPLGADFQFGVAESDLPRTTDIISVRLPPLTPGMGPQPGSITFKTMNPMPFPTNFANTPSWRKGDILSASGHTNSRALARILSAISLGGSVDGKQLLSQETVDLIFDEQANGVDLVTGMPLRFGIGYAVTGEGNTVVADFLPNGRVAFWGGMGGSLAIMDADRKLTITYVMNKMSMSGVGNNVVKEYVKSIYKALDAA